MKVLFNRDFHFDSDIFFTHQYFSAEDKFYPEHSHDFFEFFLVLHGNILHTFNGRSSILKRGDLQFIRPADTHQLRCAPDTGKIEFYNCNIRSELFLSIFYLIRGNNLSVDELGQSIHIPENQLPELIRRFETTLQLQTRPLVNRIQLESRCLLVELLYRIIRSHLEDDCPAPEWLRFLVGEMQKKENFSQGTARLFQLSGRSREHVSRSFRFFYGMTPQKFVLNLRLRHAAQELGSTRKSIAEIAFAAGFGNLAYFHSSFLKRYGTSPGKYRKTYMETSI